MTKTLRQAQIYWTPQRIHTQYRIIPLEIHLPARLEHPVPHHTISPPLLLVFYTVVFFFFLSASGAHTYLLIQASARGHYPKCNLDSQTHICVSSSELLWRFFLVPSSEILSWPVNAQVSCSNRSVGKRCPEAKGWKRSFWLQWRDDFLKFVLEGTMLTQKSGRKQWYSNSGHEPRAMMAIVIIKWWGNVNIAFVCQATLPSLSH